MEDLVIYHDAPHPSNTQALSPQPSILRRTFIGIDGLRAGWSVLIFAVLMFGLLQGVSAINRTLHLLPKHPAPNADLTPAFLFAFELVLLLTTILVTWIMSKVERRRNSVYGLGDRRKLTNFLGGLAWGVTCLSLLVLTLWKTGLLVIDSRLLFGDNVLRYGAIWLVGYLLVALCEEYLTRGYLLFTLTRGLAGIYTWLFKTRHNKALGFWTAALILSILFGLGHGSNPGESPIGLLSAGLASMVFCLSLWRTGSLWWAIGFHTSWDWAQSFLYGVADSGTMIKFHLLATHPAGKPILSGGATGPEGSIFIVATLSLIVLIILFTLPRTDRGHTSTVSLQQRPIEA
jgi:membrane protease YdiL (CAAX protease family)